MIEISGLSKTFHLKNGRTKESVKALNEIDLFIPDGKISALLGPNGAGKTTLLRMLSGLEYPDQGEVKIDGLQNKDSRKQLAFLSDGCGLYSRLSAYENIAYFGELYGLSKQEILDRVDFLSPHLALDELLTRKVSGFSQGQRMRVAIARALIHDPKTIVLDEPTNGLDLISVRRLRAFLRFLTSAIGGRKCILFSSHVMHEVERLADYIMVIVGGEIRLTGTVKSISSEMREHDFEEAFVKLVHREVSTQ